MARVPAVQRDDLAPEDRAIYDTLASTRVVINGEIQGPFGVMLYSPEAARRTNALGAYYRYEQPLSARMRHLIGLVVSRALDSQYEYTVHADLGRKEGIPPEVVDALGSRLMPEGLPEVEEVLVRFTRQLVDNNRVDDETFFALVSLMDMRSVADIIGSIGYFMMIGCAMNAFEVKVRPEQTAELRLRPGQR